MVLLHGPHGLSKPRTEAQDHIKRCHLKGPSDFVLHCHAEEMSVVSNYQHLDSGRDEIRRHKGRNLVAPIVARPLHVDSILGGIMRPCVGPRGDPIKVQVCVQFFKVGEIDTLKEQYTADVIVRARWREPSLDGKLQESGDITDIKKFWNPKLYIENSYGDPKEMFRYRVIFNDKGEAFMSEKRTVKGTFMENLELDDFPFDVQDLTVTVASEFPANEVEIVEDYESRHMVNKQSFVDEQEWHLYAHTECMCRELMIDQFDPNARRSAISVKCRAARRPLYFVWNIFMVTFLICSLSFATFSVDKKLVQNRLQLSFTLVLTAVAFKSVVNQSLPRISYLTYMDKYLLASMIMLSAVCTWHGIVTTLLSNRQWADYIETIVLGCLGVVYLLFNVGFCIMIYLFPMKKRRIMGQKDREQEKVELRESNAAKARNNKSNQKPKNSY